MLNFFSTFSVCFPMLTGSLGEVFFGEVGDLPLILFLKVEKALDRIPKTEISFDVRNHGFKSRRK